MEMIICSQVHFGYSTRSGEVAVLRGVDMVVRQGEHVAIVGPSGAGKSTLLRVLNRMYDLYPNQMAEGEVVLDGVNILRPEQDLNLLRARVGMVLAGPRCRRRHVEGDVVPRAVPVYLRAPSEALDLPGGQAEHLAQLADRPARAVGRKRRHQRRAVAPVALVHARYQHLAQLAREVEVDVGQPAQVLVQEAPHRQPAGDRIDVR